jgi:hypothetical protein
MDRGRADAGCGFAYIVRSWKFHHQERPVRSARAMSATVMFTRTIRGAVKRRFHGVSYLLLS